MGSKTFKGGVHPYEGKELAKDQPIVEVLPKGDLVYPLSQHIGAPATPVVAVGDKVLNCLLYTSPSPRAGLLSRMPSSA